MNQSNQETETSDQKPDNELITIAGGEEIEVTLRDGSKEQVKVCQILISKIHALAFAASFGNEAECIELYCDKPKGWADTLVIESVNAISDKGLELNLPLFKSWSEHQAKWREAMASDKIAELEKNNAALEKKVDELTEALRLAKTAAPPPEIIT